MLCLAKQQVTRRCVEKQSGARPDTSAKPQAASAKLDKRQAIGYYEIRKEGSMTQKEKISKIIEALRLMTIRMKKIEKDVLKLCKQKKR
jgi:hypothetical protein